ncbi:MAG: ketol-acid reductoisomerase [Gammaproteobacteria bacterium]|jgi:ketol-acid reductoisomerase
MGTFYDRDVDPGILRQRRVAIFGFGAQGRAHALNLRDSGIDVRVALRPDSPSRAACIEAGLEVSAPDEAARQSDLAMMLVPDEVQPKVYEQSLAPHLRAGAALVFAHGYNIQFGHLRPRPDLDVLLVAPLGIGDQVRATYEAGTGTPALLAVHQDVSGEAHALGLAYAAANGHGRAGIIDTSFRDETVTDLFAEQAVLCGGLTHLISGAFDTLVEAGYPEELAYFSCLHEVKLIADMIHRRGIAGMRRSISSTAEFGDYTRGPRVINQASRKQMRKMLQEIEDGRFAAELDADAEAGFPTLAAGRAAAESHAIEAVGERLRAMLPWLR